MEHISELRDSLNGYLGWNKARITCFVKMLLALVVTRTVNLNKLTCVLSTDVKQLSRYRRLQRFFSDLTNDQALAALIKKLDKEAYPSRSPNPLMINLLKIVHRYDQELDYGYHHETLVMARYGSCQWRSSCLRTWREKRRSV